MDRDAQSNLVDAANIPAQANAPSTQPKMSATSDVNSNRFGVDTVLLEGLSFLDVTEPQFVEIIIAERTQGRGGWVLTPNCDILRQAHKDPELHALFKRADALVADGMPLIWASRLQGTPLRGGRVCGSDLIFSIPSACTRAGLSIFLLGGMDGSDQRTADLLRTKYAGLRIAGTYSPPFGFEKQPIEYENMRKAVSDAQPDIIFVALGAPKSERLIQQIRSSAPNAWWIGVGASFEFVSGTLKRAPRLMQLTGTEWLFRMIQDPGRLIRRYLWDDLPYAAVLFTHALRQRFSRKKPAPNEQQP